MAEQLVINLSENKMFNKKEMEAIKKDLLKTTAEVFLLNYDDDDIYYTMSDLVELNTIADAFIKSGKFEDSSDFRFFIDGVKELIYKNYSVEIDECFNADLGLVTKIIEYKKEDEIDEIELLEKKLEELKTQRAKDNIKRIGDIIKANGDFDNFIKYSKMAQEFKPLMYHQMMHWNK